MFLEVLTSLCLLAGAQGAPRKLVPSFSGPYIIGGTPSNIEQHPYQASLRAFGGHLCGAVLIRDTTGSTNFVMSVAHVLSGVEPADVTLLMNTTSRSNADGHGVVFTVTRIKVHEGWNNGEGQFANDIAVMKLSAPATGTHVKPINRGPAEVNDDIVISGWGITQWGGDFPDRLHETTTKVIDFEECRNRTVPNARFYPGHICFFGSQGRTCNGDSGGPSVKGTGNEKVCVGMASWGIFGCPPESASVYARVSHFESWIVTNTDPNT